MKKFLLSTAAAATALIAAPAATAATIVNVDGLANASLDGTGAVNTTLAAGRYQLTFVTGAFTAFSRFSGSGGCDANGANCSTGFENSVRYIIGGTTFLLGDGAATGGIGPVSGGAYYDTASNSIANSGKYSAIFTLGAPTQVSFYLYDDNLGDNRGGVSVAATAVPEPATWAMMLMGFGMVGFGLRSRRKAKVSTSVAFA